MLSVLATFLLPSKCTLTTTNTQTTDKDGVAGFSTDEQNDIIAIWRGVSEDYAMFDVDVTTIEPVEALSSGNAVRVVVGGSSSDWYGAPAGGVAYVGRFATPNLPAFVFPAQLGPSHVKYVFEAISHGEHFSGGAYGVFRRPNT